MIQIPQRAKNEGDFPQLKVLDKKIVAAAVLLGLSNQDAFKLYHPEFLDANGRLNDTGKKTSSHFWGYGKTKDYREAYEQTVAEFIGRENAHGSQSKADDIDDRRKNKALKSLLNQAMSLVEYSTDLDPDTLKVCTDIFNRLGLIKGEVEQEIKPLRFLPLRCWSDGCRYRLFCESIVLEDEAIDECQFCKARAKAKELGYKFKDTELLNIPEDIVKRLEEKNNVKLEDIISGRIPN